MSGTAGLLPARALPGLPGAVLGDRRVRAGGQAGPEFEAGPVSDNLGYSVGIAGNVALVGAPGVNSRTGAVYVYLRHRDGWGLAAIVPAPSNEAAFGFALAMSGDTALIGAADAAFIYTGSGAHWSLRATLTAPVKSDLYFGAPVALSGSTALIGGGDRRAYIYQRVKRRWRLQATIVDPTKDSGDFFAASLALSGSTAVIGTVADVCYVYQRIGTHWHLQATLPQPATSIFNAGSLAMYGRTIMIGNQTARHSFDGAVYVYRPAGKGWRRQSTLNAPAKGNVGSFGTAVALDRTTAVVTNQPIADVGQASAYLYGWTGKAWKLQGAITDPGRGGLDDQYGTVVAVAGTTAVVGAFGANSQAGLAYVLGRQAGRWRDQSELTDPRGLPGNAHGAAVAISGPTAVVGAWGVKDQSGAAYIYARSRRRGWHHQATIADPGHQAGDMFGDAVGVFGPTIVVTASVTQVVDPGIPFYGCRAYVYARSGSRWRLQATWTSDENGMLPGCSVGISGSGVIVGATGETAILARSGTRWRKQAVLRNPLAQAGEFNAFGYAVALSGATAAVGAPFGGAAYVFVRAGRHWRLQRSISDPGRKFNDQFGTAVALSGSTLVVGAPGVRNYAGAAYFYGRSGSRWRRQATRSVTRKADIAGGFGGAIAITGTGRSAITVIGGASVSGLALTATKCGSAFEFARPAGRWRERARVLDPKCSSYDEYGYAVAVSGRTALIGAPGAHRDAGLAFVQKLPAP